MNLPTISLRIIGKPVAKGRARSNPIMRNGKPVLDKRGRPIIQHYTPHKTKQCGKDIEEERII